MSANGLYQTKTMLEDFRLKVFMTVAAQRSFTKAATALGISQPAVSQNISELEKMVGVKLFDRLRGEVAITPQGLVFQSHAEKILDSYNNMNHLFCNPRINGRTIPVRVFISPILSGFILTGLTDILQTLQPDLAVELSPSAENAHVRILAITEKKDTDLSIKVDVQSDDILLAAFFRQLVNEL